MSRVRIGVIADDLTGALDTAGAFASRGLRSRVVTAPADKIDIGYSGEVVCVNTQTRNVDAALAIAPAHRVAKELTGAGWNLLYKKVDSTGRGNLAAECQAVMDAQGAVAAMVCPAFPRMGRTVLDGVLMVDNAPVTQSIEGTDELSLVSSASLLELMTIEGELTAGLVPLSFVRSGIEAIRAKVDELTNQGCNTIVVDADTDSDLRAIARCSIDYPDALIVGSAGLAYAVADVLDVNRRTSIEGTTVSNPVVIVAGSRHKVTGGQVAAVSSTGMAQVISISPQTVLGSREERVGYSKQVMDEIERLLFTGQNVALTWDDADLHNPNEPSFENAAALANFAGLLVYGITRRATLGGLIIAGGDTAFGVLRALGASNVDVCGEVESGVPLGVIGDGVGAGLTLVTKAGGFGDEGLFIRALESIGKPGGSEN